MPTAAQQLMIADGLPAAAVIPEPERKAAWAVRARANPAPEASIKEIAMKTETVTKPSKADQQAALRIAKANRKNVPALPSTHPANRGPKARKQAAGAPKPKAATKKAAKAKARTPASATPAQPGSKVIRPGSKLEIVVGLLTREKGCTSADVLKATDWPAVSMPQQARAAGLTLRQEKDGKVTRYWAS